MSDIERQAREAAIDHGMWLAPDDNETNYQAFIAGYYRGWSDKGAEIAKADLAAAKPREKEIAELRAEVSDKDKKLTHLRDVATRELKDRDEAIAKLGRRVHRTHDILDAVRANEEHLESEVVKLRAWVAELEGMVPRWVDIFAPDYDRIARSGWVSITPSGKTGRLRLMVPPIPLPGEGV